MATLTPSQLPNLREDGGLFRELDVLERLRLGLQALLSSSKVLLQLS